MFHLPHLRFTTRSPPKQAAGCAALVLALAHILAPTPAQSQTGSIDFTTTLQHIEGFGFSAAFGEANALRKLPPESQRKILDLLYSPQTGAGLTILRLGIMTDSNIEPNAPASPTDAPAYTFDGSDGGQVWLAQQAQKYGLNNFIADAWTAPIYMKTTRRLAHGGSLCGVPDAHCASGDWRQAYADYLLKYVADYKSVSIPIGTLGFTNEPDLAASYASMLFTPAQAIDFIKVLGPTVKASGLPLKLHCCDSSKWALGIPFTTAIMADPTASSYIDIISPHEYGTHATSPQPTTKPVWMTEWASSNGVFEPRWDCGGCPGGPDGMYLANDIIQAFNAGNVDAYLYWWGTSTGAAALIKTTDADYTIAARYYALAAISRFIRPDAFRVSSTNTNASLNAVAFRNPDGSKIIAILNTAKAPIPATFAVDTATASASAKTYLTDATHNIEETNTATIAGRTLTATLPPRSLTTIILPPAAIKGTIKLVATSTLQKLGDGSLQATVKIANSGSGTAQNVQLKTALLDATSGTPAPGVTLPQSIGSIAGGGYVIVPLNFPSASGAPTTERIAGTYTGGSFKATIRTTLP
jgi:glucuronoarabinoxylan endo-1,4-beta-xylanase